MLNEKLKTYMDESILPFNKIDSERKNLLQDLAEYIKKKVIADEVVNLVFICTHNSRRSHISQLWAQAAAYYFNIPNVFSYSGGTEATAFNPRAVKAMEKAGFVINQPDFSENPQYKVIIDTDKEPIVAFSKKFTHTANPQTEFAAIMTCDNADEACPVVPGADARFPVKYKDPKEADDTPEEEARYDERCRQICIEMLYTFSLVRQSIKN